ncbi:MAG: histidine phosphatase family protein [Mycobacteriales bacterium]
MNRSLLLLRHGRTTFNAEERIQGSLDVPLDDLGRAQAAAVSPVLARMRPAAVLSSDLARAHETAQAIGAPVVLDPRLREIELGGWQGLTLDEAREAFPEEWKRWRAGEDIRRGGGETYVEVAARATAAICDALDGVPQGGLLLVVTHGGTARVSAATLLGVPYEQWWRLGVLGNCCWTRLRETPRGWALAEHGASVPHPR